MFALPGAVQAYTICLIIRVINLSVRGSEGALLSYLLSINSWRGDLDTEDKQQQK